MTLDEVIKHEEEKAEEQEELANKFKSFKDYGNPKSSITSGYKKCLICAEEHRQLAEWLKDYKRLLEQQDALDKIRAEIEQMDFDFGDFYDHTDTIKEMILQIIDKYTESEG